MVKKILSITIIILLILPNLIFGSEKDSLNLDKNSKLVWHKLPDNFKENYDNDDFVYEYNFDAHKKSAWEQFNFWISRKFQDWFGFADSRKAQSFTSRLFNFFYIVIILVVLYFIIKTFINQEGNWVFGRTSDKIKIKSNNLDDNILETNYDQLISESISQGKYRFAIRYYYLKTLKNLTKANKIEWDYEKTNSDYYNEIEDTNLKDKFQYISYLYNYCWYGEFEINQHAFNEAELSFKNLFKDL